MSKLCTIYALTKQLINNRHYDNKTISRIIETAGVKSPMNNKRGFPVYDLDEITTALRNTVMESKTSNTGATLVELKEEKIRREIEQIKADVEKKELQIQQLRLRLIDYDEALTYFIRFKSAVSSILRKQFLSQMPIEVTGLDPARAREKGEQYFNEVMDVIAEGIDNWKDEFTIDETK